MDTPRIDEIARRLMERVPPALRSMQADLESNFKAILRERLTASELEALMAEGAAFTIERAVQEGLAGDDRR